MKIAIVTDTARKRMLRIRIGRDIYRLKELQKKLVKLQRALETPKEGMRK